MAFSRKVVPVLETVVALVSIGCGWLTYGGKYWPYVFALISLRAIFTALAKQRRAPSNVVQMYKAVKPLSTSLVSALLIFATFLTIPDVRLPSFQEQVFILNLSFSLGLFAYLKQKKDLLKYVMIPAGVVVSGTCLMALASNRTRGDTRRAAITILLGICLWLGSFVVKKLVGKSTGRVVKRFMLVASVLCFAAPIFDD